MASFIQLSAKCQNCPLLPATCPAARQARKEKCSWQPRLDRLGDSWNHLPKLSHPDGSPIRALVVDDEPSLSELMSMGLRKAGLSVAVAADGPEAVKLAKDFRPDVPVLAVMFPDSTAGNCSAGSVRSHRRFRRSSSRRRRHPGPHRGPGSGRRRLRHQAFQHGRGSAPAPSAGATFRCGGPGHRRAGGGIPEQFVDHVFSRFARADAAGKGAGDQAGASAAEGTSGVGLSVVQSIVEAHGGKVTVTSQPGRTQFALQMLLMHLHKSTRPFRDVRYLNVT